MHNKLTGNKIAAAVLLAALLFFGIKVFIKEISHISSDETETYAYAIEIPETSSRKDGAIIEEHIDLGTLFLNADPERGKIVAKKCAACHTFEKNGKMLTGPNLWNIVGRMAASTNGFTYSKAMKEFGKSWDYNHLFYYLEKPKKYIKGTAMSFAGIKKPKDRADLLAYLKQNSDQPIPFPKPDLTKPNETELSDTKQILEQQANASEELKKEELSKSTPQNQDQ